MMWYDVVCTCSVLCRLQLDVVQSGQSTWEHLTSAQEKLAALLLLLPRVVAAAQCRLPTCMLGAYKQRCPDFCDCWHCLSDPPLAVHSPAVSVAAAAALLCARRAPSRYAIEGLLHKITHDWGSDFLSWFRSPGLMYALHGLGWVRTQNSAGISSRCAGAAGCIVHV